MSWMTKTTNLRIDLVIAKLGVDVIVTKLHSVFSSEPNHTSIDKDRIRWMRCSWG